MSSYSRDIGYDYAEGTARAWDREMRREDRRSDRAERQRGYMRYRKHEPRIGLLGPNFCEVCEANIRLHDHVPYGRKETP
jgi:hypothetical protein